MKLRSFSHSQQKVCFLCGITAIYLAIAAWLNFLQGPPWWDEADFWQSSLTFSDSLLPSLADLREYYSLNTPLPFMVFGLLEYLFGQGMVAGRLFNLLLSLGIVATIGWPSKDKGGRAILCLIGLFLCPYFLFLSGRLYTEMITCTWVLLGFVAYLRDRHWVSCLAFVLAIASRQYMLAFPAAIATYEFLATAQQYRQGQPVGLAQHQRWLAPAVASLSLLGWVALFDGLAPADAIAAKSPEVQKSTLALTPGGAINFLAFVGAYIVIPEFLLFRPVALRQALRHHWQKGLLIAVGLLLVCLAFPPLDTPYGTMGKVADLLPYGLVMAMYYGLALLTCLRFARPDLLFWLIVFNALIMMKAIPWDRYVLPLAVAFWYLKSLRYPGADAQTGADAGRHRPSPAVGQSGDPGSPGQRV
ncbi:ArnT family glycosyltransferase [Nodosilinea sp. PGN35]|uniref:ArnT family glycosyltransferase n=1 Tax=Nodosilinea sp. PGN35 TaxID=3020489 RepID=UPI0023B2E387|nr:hypothetical protein [Nodosilinea sp. TSF1-S3]MDF0365941.1 hypothetical protein [Nodosilinea sp. TSF1-S3]